MARFRRDGYEASGIKPFMKDAGLTAGGFYAHFDSKEDLLASGVEIAHERTRHLVETAIESDAGIWGFVEGYLSARHRDDPGDGCPTAALVQEIARQGPEVRKVYEESLNGIFESIERGRPGEGGEDESRQWSIGLAAMLVGGLVFSRAVKDQKLSDEILEACRAMAPRIAESNPDPREPTVNSDP